MMSAAYRRHKEREEDEVWRGVAKLAKSLADIATKQTLDDDAPNKVALWKRMAIARLAREGKGVRAIARELRISPNTVDRYFPRDAKCECGKLLIDHRGWCSVRFKQSEARQAALKKLHDAQRENDPAQDAS